jgi:hypothetical protein
MADDKVERMGRILGLGFDQQDGHVRITHGEGFDVYLGSDDSHEAMSRVCCQIEEELKRRGKKLQDLTREEFKSILKSLEE